MSDLNLHEYDTIIWDPATLFRQLGSAPPFSQAASNLLATRLDQLHGWIATGHDPFILLSQMPSLAFRTAGGQLNFDLQGAPVFPNIKFQQATGSRVEYCGPESARELFSELAPRSTYHYILTGDALTPLLRVQRARPGNDQVVGGFFRIGEGHVFLLPPSNAAPDYLFDQLTAVPKRLNGQSSFLPPWAEALGSETAVESSSEIKAALNTMTDLQAKIDANRQIISSEAWIRQLFAGSGSSFTEAVARALRELEFAVVDGPHPRADLLAFRDNSVLALECKGLDGAARETHFRQTERWVSEVAATLAASPEERAADADLKRYAEQLTALGALTEGGASTSECRGMMVIGTFKATPLDQRAELDFPDSVQRLVNRSRICALTGLQLALLLLSCRKDAEHRPEVARRLLTTNGIIADVLQWTELVKKIV